MDQSKEWLSKEEVCQALNMDLKQFRRYQQEGLFPAGILRGKRRVYHTSEIKILVWLEQNQHRFPKRTQTPVKGKNE